MYETVIRVHVYWNNDNVYKKIESQDGYIYYHYMHKIIKHVNTLYTATKCSCIVTLNRICFSLNGFMSADVKIIYDTTVEKFSTFRWHFKYTL